MSLIVSYLCRGLCPNCVVDCVVTALPLGEVRGLTRLILRDLVDLVVAALARGAVSLPFLGNVDHIGKLNCGRRAIVSNAERR